MNLLTLSWKNLTNRPLNMLLSLVLFALGVGLISLLLLLEKQLQEKFDKNLAGIDLVIGAKGSPLQLILNSMYHIDAPTGNIPLADVRAFLNPQHPLFTVAIPLSLGDNYENFRVVGTTTDFVDSLYQGQVAEGKLFEQDFQVTIGATVAKQLKLKLGDTFYSGHGMITHEDAPAFEVVGILAPNGSVLDQLIVTTTQSIWKVHAEHSDEEEAEEDEANHEGHDHADAVELSSEHEHDHEHEEEHHSHEIERYATPAEAKLALMQDTSEFITSLLIRYKNNKDLRVLNLPRNINENTDLLAANPIYEVNRLGNMLGIGVDLLRALAFIIVGVSGLSIFISLFSSLKDRKYELALMRVMGASRGKLFLLIILEGLVLAALGYLVGIVLSHGGMELLASALKESYGYSFTGREFLPQEWVLLAGALAVGFIAAVIPAIQASNTDISETLTVDG